MKISDHALLRYLERVRGIDVGEVEREIMTPFVRDAIAAGAGKVKVNGVTFIIRDQCLVTVLDETMKRVKRDPNAARRARIRRNNR